MTDRCSNEPLLDMFVFETSQLIEQLEELTLSTEKSSCFTQSAIDEIFRIMHTIKGSSAMMMFENISTLAHSIEDVFYFIRQEKPENIDCSAIFDLILEGIDFIKTEIGKIMGGSEADGDAAELIASLKAFLVVMKQNNGTGNEEKREEKVKQQYYISPEKNFSISPKNIFKATIYFENGCEMENIRAYSIVHNIKRLSDEIYYIPNNIVENDGSAELIRKDGFTIYIKSECTYEEINEFLAGTVFLKKLELAQLQNDDELIRLSEAGCFCSDRASNQSSGKAVSEERDSVCRDAHNAVSQNSIISVSVSKLDKLMDLVGEMVIAEAMVIQNPDLKGLELDSFQKSARHLSKITDEIQDMVMSIRMVPLSTTFHKMHRIVRDMCKKLEKEVELEIIGEETEVDKNIIEHISDPLMHLVRNSLDHGIETYEERISSGKPRAGRITLEAKNAGSDVQIIIKILQKARDNDLLHKPPEDMTDREIYSLIFLPGFSTKENVTEFSGRGVGMDVVTRNIEAIGGVVSVDSIADKGTTIILRIPLTLAIIDGMNIKVGNSRYTIPTISIKESFRPKESDIITDPQGNEMIMVRGQCYPILRLHEIYRVKTCCTKIHEGIIIMVEQDGESLCIFADELLGQQQVVVKSLPEYIKRFKAIKGLASCTLLGDGSISLILDIAGLIGL